IFDDAGTFIGYRGTGCDITREVAAQQRAHRAQELLMHTVENVPTMMVLFDNQERFVMCNQAYREALPGVQDLLVDGTTFEDISRISAERGLVPEYRDNPQGWVDYRLKRFRNPGEPVIHQQLDGRWVMTTDHRTPDGGTLIMRTDITAIKMAEEEIRAKEAITQSFIDAMEDPAAMIDLDANFVLANKAMGDQFNAHPRDLIGRPIFKNPPTEAGKRRRAWVDQVAKSGIALREVDHHEDRWHNISITPVFGPDAKVTQIAIVAQDITEDVRKDSLLRKMSQATEQSADLVVITDVHGRIEYVNRKFTETTGFAPEEVIGKNPRVLASGDTPATVYRELWDTVLAGQVWRGDLKDRRKDGTFFWAAVTITPICDANGKIINFVSSHVDISERKASEEALREAMLRTEIANRSKTELLANMSHELRTPLNAIIGFSDTMRFETFGPMSNAKYIEYANDINHSGTHLLQLVNDILDVSAIEIGKLNLNEDVLNMADVLNASIRLLAPRIQEGGIRLTTDFGAGDVKLLADERRIKQIALNLLSNAAKFTEAGGQITVSMTRENDGALAVAFADTGIGMNTKEIAIAMTKFGQVDGGLARKHQGTGLGLPLTQKLVEAHNGTLIISSAKGVGTTATIRFPKERVSD
ncbi:MAG TPA: PAS domain S-box protein, partial [Magnetovibrio sp.]